MKTGCCGGCPREPSQGPWLPGLEAGAEFQGTGSPGGAVGGKPRVADMARPCLIHFRPLPSRTMRAPNPF